MYPYPDRHERPMGGDPRTAANRGNQPLQETRSVLSQARSLLGPSTASAVPPAQWRSSAGPPAARWLPSTAGPSASTQWPQNWPGSSGAHNYYNPAAGPSSSAHPAERLSIFRPRGRQRSKFSAQRAKKRKLWEHTFCCLASRKQRAPPGPMERGVLMTAGLGEKSIVLDEVADAEEVHMELLQAYPRLQSGGGYVTFSFHNQLTTMISV